MQDHEILIKHKYLNFPVQDGAPKRKIRFRLKGQVVRVFEIELAGGEPDFWVVSDVSMFRSEKLEIEVGDADTRHPAETLATIIQSDTIEGGENLYREKYRPQFHFTSRRGWHNDPNGLVYYKDTFHLFYQHNPYGWHWGNMHWGHAASKNLVQWQELDEALYPDDMGVMYSGDVPPQDGRRIQIAWLFGDLPGMPFNQQMTFPVELSLKTTADGPRLHFWPVKEIEQLYQKPLTLENIDLSTERTVLPTDDHDLLDIQATIELGDANEIKLNLRGIRLC